MQMESPSAVIAFIQPFQLDAVVDELRRLPAFPGMSVSDVRGLGTHGAHPPRDGEPSEVAPLEKKVRLEIVCTASAAAAKALKR